MALNQEVELLRRIPLFAGLEPKRLMLLAFSSKRLVFEEGQMLFRQGDVGDAAYVLIGGAADVLVHSDGAEIKVATLGTGEFVGEIAILCDLPRTATVRAASRLDTLRIEKDSFLRMLREFPEMSAEVIRELGLRLARTTAKVSELSQARR